MVEINGDRLLADLYELRSFGASGTGVVRTTYSDVDMAARRWLASRMSEAGLLARVDGIGNVVGRSPNSGPTLIVGSHSDTQPTGGWLDGALGVIYGLEVARALLEDEATSDLAVDAVAWVDEEATYLSCLGSRAFCGDLTDSDVDTTANAAGETIAEALTRLGLDRNDRSQIDPSRHIGYLEAHIEQGPNLIESDELIGVVTGIVGIRGCRVAFSGQQNHAGTTPMHRRSDAGVALFDFAVRLRERFTALAGATTVWTIGTASLSPGAQSIIPGHAEFFVQFRDPDDQRLEAMEKAVQALAVEATASGSVAVTAARTREPIRPTFMDAGFQEHLDMAAQHRVGAAKRFMPSAAGHDPMIVSHHLPCGMIFIPSIDGVSHDFAENSADSDIVTGCRVLADGAASILQQANAR